MRVVASPAPEARSPNEAPSDYVIRMAEEKARRAAGRAKERGVVVSADTVVVAGEEVLGKPGNKREAERMLRLLSGRTHRVISGVALYNMETGELTSGSETTEVTFAPMSSEEITWYVESGEPMDKAGAYAVQGLASLFIKGIRGSHFNVMGLPLKRLYEVSRGAGTDLRAYIKRRERG